MSLTPLDDLLAHQTTETFDRVFTSDRNFYDRYYFNMHSSSDELFLDPIHATALGHEEIAKLLEARFAPWVGSR